MRNEEQIRSDIDKNYPNLTQAEKETMVRSLVGIQQSKEDIEKYAYTEEPQLKKRVSIDMSDVDGIEDSLEVTMSNVRSNAVTLKVNGQKVSVDKQSLLEAIDEAERSLNN